MRLLKNYKIKTIFTNKHKFDKCIKLKKDKLGLLDRCNGIYMIDCSCTMTYVGRISRLLRIRIKEYRNKIIAE